MASGIRNINEQQRFLNKNEEPNKLLSPLSIPATKTKGKQPLRECLESIIDANLIPDLLNQIASSLNKCTNPKDGLTQDQSATLYMYSLQGAFYTRCNRALCDEDRTKAVLFYDYYILFMSALNKLPSTKDHVWRDVIANMSDIYTSGSIHVWHAAISCTGEVIVTDTFLDKNKHNKLFNIKCFNEKLIRNHSRFPEENEIILPPGTCIRVKARSNPAKKLHIISCEETTLICEEMNNLLAPASCRCYIMYDGSDKISLIFVLAGS